MRKKMKQLIGILLTLVMVLGQMPGMSLTAYANEWEGNPYASLVNTTNVITFDDKAWYLIEDNSTAADAGTVTLLAKECVDASPYDSGGSFVEYSGNPTVKNAVDTYYTNNISTAAKAVVSGSGMFLLTKDQANAITNAAVRMCSKASGAEYNGWWLCSPGLYGSFFDAGRAAFVDGGSGTVHEDGNEVEDTFGVRPALKLNLSSVIFSSESKTFTVVSADTRTFVDFTMEMCNMASEYDFSTLPEGVTASGTFDTDQHGYRNFTITVPVDGPVRFTIGDCRYGNKNIPVKNKDDETIATLNYPAAGCYGPSTPGNVFQYIYTGGADTLTFDSIQYCNYFKAEAIDYVPVTGVTLDKTEEQTIKADDKVSFTATVSPEDATDKTVKWSVGGTKADAVKLYTDAACTTGVSEEATETLTVYAKGISEGSATVTVTSNADDTKKASCEVKVEPKVQTEDVDDTTEANKVSDKISELPSKEAVTKNDKTAIDAAKAAFDALTDDQKAKVSDADKQKLNDAVAAIEAIEKDEAAAKAVSDKIAALPAKDAVTKDDKAAINAAKKAFDALTDDQKKKVSEADRQKLDDAVAALAAIDGEGNTPTPTPTPVPVANVSGNDTVSIKKLELNVKGAQTLSVGEEATIKAAVTGRGSDASLNSVNWVAPSGHVVVTEVQADGNLKVKAVGPGTAFVTAVCGGKAKTVKYTVKQPVNKAEASLNAITLSVKEKYRICVNLDAPTTDKFFYATNDKKVCAVNGKGIIAAKGVGTTTVDILAGEKKKTAKKVASVTVTVKEGEATAVEVKDVSINYVGNKTLYTGEMAYISTLVNGGANNGGQAVKYRFSAKGIVKIDAYGHLTAKKAGKVTVTASCDGKEASVELTVQQPLKTLKVNKTYVKVKQGKAKTVTLSVKTSPAQGKSDIKAVWSVANEGNGVKKISDESGKAVFEVSEAAKDTVVTATVTDPVTGKTYTVNSVIDVN